MKYLEDLSRAKLSGKCLKKLSKVYKPEELTKIKQRSQSTTNFHKKRLPRE